MFTMIAMAAGAATVADVGTTPYAIMGGLVVLATLLGKIVDKAWDHMKKKDDEQHTPIVQLDPETLKLFSGMQNDIERTKKVLDDHLDEERSVVEMLRESTVYLKDIGRINERLVKHFDDRMDHVDVSLRSVQDEVMKMRRAV